MPVRDFACGGRSKRKKRNRQHPCQLMGLRDAVRVAVPAYWASWVDCTPMIFNRHPDVANLFVHELEGAREGALGAAAEARRAVFDPTWEDLAHGARPPPAEPEDMKPWSGRGWQHVAASKVEFQHRGGVVYSHGAEPQSAGEVAGWSRGRCGPLCCSNASSHSHSSPFIPRCAVVTATPANVCTSRRVGATRVRIGKCDSQSLPGGRWEGCHQRHGSRFGLGRSTGGRCTQVGSCRGIPLFGGCQLAVDASREHGWGGFAQSSPWEGANVPRTGGPSKTGPRPPCCLEVACPLKPHPS